MRTPSCLRRYHRGAAAGMLLTMAALLVSGAACDGNGNNSDTYQLAVSSASGGSVAAPGAGTFTYDAGMVVQLLATPDEGYEFCSWSGDVASIGDPSAASTSITMNGDCAIVANFEIEGETSPDEESGHQQ